MKKRILSFVLAIVMILVLVPGAFATSNPWSQDDAPSQWAQGYVREAYNQNLVPSNLMGRFYHSITRSEFTALAVSLYETVTGTEITGRVTFTDTNDVNVEKMAYLDVVRGVGGGRFNPDGLLTRQEAAAMLSRLIGVIETPMRNHPATFADGDSISGWATDYVGQMRLFGIMGGVGGNRFDPHGRYTIEQSITTMLRVFQMESVAEINAFLCGFDLYGMVRNAYVWSPIQHWPGTGQDFTIGEEWSTGGSWGRTAFRMLNFADPSWFYLPSFSMMGAENSGTQTGDVFIIRRTLNHNNSTIIGINIDLGNAHEVWYERTGTPMNNPAVGENYRAIAQFVRSVTDCNC